MIKGGLKDAGREKKRHFVMLSNATRLRPSVTPSPSWAIAKTPWTQSKKHSSIVFRPSTGSISRGGFIRGFTSFCETVGYKLAAGRKKREASSSDDMEILAPPASIRPEETMLLEQAMLELPAEDRELVTLRHLDGLSYQELAERLEVPQGTIMSRLYYARKRLREKLARHSFTGLSEG